MSDPLNNSGLDSTEIADGDSPSGGLRTRMGSFFYHGEPIYLLQTGTYGLRPDRGYDGRDPGFWQALIERLSGVQSAGVRFRIRIDPWAFCYDLNALSPWSATPTGWDLSRFDETFWSVLRGAAELAFSRDVLIELVLFNTAPLRLGRGGTGWARNPFNAALGGPLSRDPSSLFYNLPFPLRFDLAERNADEFSNPAITLQAAQERFVREAVRRLDGLDNISWEVTSQMEGVDPARSDFVAHFVEYLRRIDKLDRVATASVRTLRRADHDLYRLIGIDTVQFWLPSGLEPHEELIETIVALRQYAKPVVVGEADVVEGYTTMARAFQWQAYVAGGHPCVAGLMDGDGAEMLRAFVSFVEETSPGALRPERKVVMSRTEGLHCHAGRAENGVLVLYATTESPASDVEASLRLSPGKWRAISVLPSTGEVLAETELEAARPATQLPLPSFEEDLAVRITKQ